MVNDYREFSCIRVSNNGVIILVDCRSEFCSLRLYCSQLLVSANEIMADLEDCRQTHVRNSHVARNVFKCIHPAAKSM
jgi:hypothetical protein